MRRLLFAIAAMLLATPALATPKPQVSVISTSVDEGLTATVRAKRTGDLSRSSSVIFSTSNATAISGTNYSTRSGSLTFAPGASLSSSALVPTIRDGHVTPNLYFIVRLGVVSNATIQANGTVTVRNIDQPPPPPPVQCPDGSTVPAGQACPVPPPPSMTWVSAPLHDGGFARVAAITDSDWEVMGPGRGRPLVVGEIVAVYFNGWSYDGDNQVSRAIYAISDGAAGRVLSKNLVGVAPSGNPPLPSPNLGLPTNWWVPGLVIATKTCPNAFDPALPGVTQGGVYRAVMMIGTHRTLAPGETGWAGGTWIVFAAGDPWMGARESVSGDCLIGQ